MITKLSQSRSTTRKTFPKVFMVGLLCSFSRCSSSALKLSFSAIRCNTYGIQTNLVAKGVQTIHRFSSHDPPDDDTQFSAAGRGGNHGDRPLPPTLESFRNFHDSAEDDDDLGALHYDEFDDNNESAYRQSESYKGEGFPDLSKDWIESTTDAQLSKTSLASLSADGDPHPRKSLVLFADDFDDTTIESIPISPTPQSLFPEIGKVEPTANPVTEQIGIPLASLNLRSLTPGRERSGGRDQDYIRGASGMGITTDLEALKTKLESITQAIYKQNAGEEFNINSIKQLSMVLFGVPDESTDKDALYAIASAGNKMADLILQHRKCKVDIRRMEKKTSNIENGVYITSAIKTSNNNASQDPLLLVDASAYIFRAYYSMPPFHRADGTPIGAVLGFCNMLNRLVLNRLISGERPRLVLVFDPIGKNFRHDLFPDYKANRKECPMDLKPQFALIREAAKAYGIKELEAEGYEADDVIATLVTMAMKEGVDCHILSGDKDLMQLITPLERTESYVHVIDPMSMTRVDYTAVVEKWGVGPELVGDLLAIVGDTSDNIPGIKGLGPKTGTSLLQQFKSLEAILANPAAIEKKAQRTKIEENIEVARLSRQLVELVRDIPREQITFPNQCSVADLRMENLHQERLLKFYDNMGFHELKKRLEGRLSIKSITGQKKQSSWKAREKVSVPTPEDFQDVPF